MQQACRHSSPTLSRTSNNREKIGYLGITSDGPQSHAGEATLEERPEADFVELPVWDTALLDNGTECK